MDPWVTQPLTGNSQGVWRNPKDVKEMWNAVGAPTADTLQCATGCSVQSGQFIRRTETLEMLVGYRVPPASAPFRHPPRVRSHPSSFFIFFFVGFPSLTSPNTSPLLSVTSLAYATELRFCNTSSPYSSPHIPLDLVFIGFFHPLRMPSPFSPILFDFFLRS